MKIKKLLLYLFFFIFSLSFCTPVYADEVVLKNAKVVESFGEPTIEAISINNNTITSGIKFNNLNEFVVLELELENHSNNSIELESIDNLISSNYLNVESNSIGTIINRDSSNSIRVKITYANELLNQDEIYFRDASIKLNFGIIPLENPNTSGMLVIIIKIILLINIGFSTFILLKRKKKLAFLGLLFIPLMVYAKDSREVIINFDDIRAKGRFEEYSVIITNENGETEERTITYGEPIELPSNVTKTGYRFLGWVDQNGNSISNGDIITGEIEITPSFDIITYSITYNLNNGVLEHDNPTTYTVEDEFTLYNPSRVGYSFSGWMEGNDGVIISSMTIYQGTTGDKTFTAIYSPNQNTAYKVIHKKMNLEGEYDDEDVEIENLTTSTGSQVTPQRRDYPGFIAPEGQRVTIAGDGSTTVTYYYEREQYTFRITDRTYITSAIEDGQYYYGTTISITADERVGYDFKWNDNNTDYEREFTLTGNTILTPIYTAKNVRYLIYHCYMKLDGETYYCGSSTQSTAKADSTVVAYIHSKEGFTNPEPATITIAADGSTKHYYYYTRNKYQLTLTDSEFITTNTPSGEYFYETSISLTAKTREGYTFTKWSDDSVTNPYTFELKGDKTIGPVYTRNQYLITLDPNGGSVDPTEIVVSVGSSIGTLPTPTTTQNHTTFLGWYTLPDGGDLVTENTYPSGSITIYAHWEYHPEATFNEGTVVNAMMKKVAGNNSATFTTIDSNIEQIKVGATLPSDFIPTSDNTISTSESDEPIYIWYDSTNKYIYYYTEAEKIILASKTAYMFRDFRKLETIEALNTWDGTNVKDATYMFWRTGYDASTFELNFSNWQFINNDVILESMFSSTGYNSSSYIITGLSNWNMLNVSNIGYMFSSAGENATTWNIGDLSNWNVSNVTKIHRLFYHAGYKATSWDIGNIAEWDVSKVDSIWGMFEYAGYSATTFEIDLSSWNVSNVTDMSTMFYYAGRNATTWSVGDLSNWKTSNVENMSSMFYYAGYNATTFDIGDLSNWKTSNVEKMASMFYYAGYNATTWSIGDLSEWNTSNVTTMSSMFNNAGYKATTWSIGDLSEWNTSNVTTMSSMFHNAGYKATTWSIGDLSEWNTSNVTTMSSMFNNAGYTAESFVLDLSTWNVSSVTSMSQMFSNAGRSATTWSIGDLSNWDTLNVTNMYGMFEYAGYSATTWNSIGTLKIYADDLRQMFSYCKKAKVTLNIYNNPSKYGPSGYFMFFYAATNSDALITVNYTNTTTNIDDIIATKSNGSNVVKGSLITTS